MFRQKFMKKMQEKGKKLDPLEQKAKMDVVNELHGQASSMLGEKIHPLKKVTVASDSKEGLEAGLEKAAGMVEKVNKHETDPEKLVEQAEEESSADLDKDNEMDESPEHKAKILDQQPPEDIEAEHADCSPEELDDKIQKLMALKHKKESGLA